MYDSTSHMHPGYRFQYQVPPKSPPFSTIRKSVIPRRSRFTAASIPAKPPPRITTSVSTSTASRVDDGSAHGSRSRSWSPSSWYCATPSARRRFSRSRAYLACTSSICTAQN
jgi:hypothetical protein